MLTRLALLFSIAWVMGLKDAWFTILGQEISGRDFILITGGLFLLYKSTHEIHQSMEGIEEERQSLFTVLTELYVNALDHGVLGLDSALKSDPTGFAEYFQEREQRLDNLQSGQVSFYLNVEQNEGSRSMKIRIEDSGKGFDYQNQPIMMAQENTDLAGRGIMLIKNLCESLTYLEGGNVVEAIYNWKTT